MPVKVRLDDVSLELPQLWVRVGFLFHKLMLLLYHIALSLVKYFARQFLCRRLVNDILFLVANCEIAQMVGS